MEAFVAVPHPHWWGSVSPLSSAVRLQDLCDQATSSPRVHVRKHPLFISSMRLQRLRMERHAAQAGRVLRLVTMSQ